MKELAAALSKAQAQFKHISRDKTVTVRTRTGGAYTFSYAPLESIMAAIKGALSENGIALLQDIRDGKVVTILLHTSGDCYTSSGTVLKVSEDTMQAYGSALTYARRYDLSLALGLCPDDDDDGNAADGNTATPAPLKATITPTTGAWDDVPKDRHEFLHRIGDEIIEYLNRGSLEDAYKAFYQNLDEKKIDNDEGTCVWELLKVQSKGRASLKKMRDQRLLAQKEIVNV